MIKIKNKPLQRGEEPHFRNGLFYCVAKRILKALQSVKNGFAPPFSLCFSKSRAARQSPFCKAVARPFQSRRKALPKSTKTGRKSVGFLILTQAPKCTRSHCFPPQKHPKNGFMMRFAGKNSFFQLRARDFSFYMNAYICTEKNKIQLFDDNPID